MSVLDLCKCVKSVCIIPINIAHLIPHKSAADMTI